MEGEDFSKKFIKTVALLVSIRNSVGDKFFYNKLNDKILNFGFDFLNFTREASDSNAAQHQVRIQKCLADLASFGEDMKELAYLNLVSDRPLLLKTEYRLLILKLEILKNTRNINTRKIETEKNKNEIKQIMVNERPLVTRSKPRERGQINENKKKILDYIKSYPNTRTKDIIYEFNALSGRTVKRNLTDLTRAGLVKKRVDNKAVYYYASE